MTTKGKRPAGKRAPTRRAKPSLPPIVAIGASAGGLAALEELFVATPADPGMAFVVVMHLDAKQKSVLAELLQRCTRMPVQVLTRKTRPKPGHLYVAPPGVLVSGRQRGKGGRLLGRGGGAVGVAGGPAAPGPRHAPAAACGRPGRPCGRPVRASVRRRAAGPRAGPGCLLGQRQVTSSCASAELGWSARRRSSSSSCPGLACKKSTQMADHRSGFSKLTRPAGDLRFLQRDGCGVDRGRAQRQG